jgi:hypothetical protein
LSITGDCAVDLYGTRLPHDVQDKSTYQQEGVVTAGYDDACGANVEQGIPLAAPELQGNQEHRVSKHKNWRKKLNFRRSLHSRRLKPRGRTDEG